LARSFAPGRGAARSHSSRRVLAHVGLLVALLLFVVGPLPVVPPARADTPRLILGTTVGLQRTGLLDVLVPLFERQTGRTVTTVAVSAPQVLALGVRGELDVLLVDAGDDAAPYIAAGHGVDRRLVLHADDVLVGPRTDPARAAEAASVPDALRRIAEAQSGWVSRGDNSALFQLEKRLWRDAGLDPVGAPWYVALGQGMVPTLAAATERQAYTLADRQSYLERRDLLDLSILVQGAPDLLRLYDVIVVNPAKGLWIDDTGARAFADFLLGPEAQTLIGGYGADRFGQAVFVPDAGRAEDTLRPARRPAP
jgi:tungstate transport system substrate-binding protein